MAKNPKRIYDSAKLMSEHLCIYYQGNMSVDTVVLRFATTYGPGKTARHGKMGVTSQIVEAPAAGRPFHIAQGGDEKDDFIYNKDSALGIYLATIAKNPQSRIYNIGSGVGATLRDFERALRKHLPDADIRIGPGLNFLGMPYPAHGIYDISRAREELGFKPAYDLDAGVADYLESLNRIRAKAA
jgi:UDP-glucose 4-epimerase